MKVIGRRRQAPLSFAASGELLAQGARFNDDLRGLPTGDAAFIPNRGTALVNDEYSRPTGSSWKKSSKR